MNAVAENPRSEQLRAMSHEELMAEMDAIECALVESLPPYEPEIAHQFTEGLYARAMMAVAGSIITSKIHKKQHQYAMLKGKMLTWSERTGWTRMVAPCVGVTEPGTRRLGIVEEDIVWVTYHPTTKTDLSEIEMELIEKRELKKGELCLGGT